MLEKLQNLVVNSYSPYSNYKTSSIVVVSDGREFEGVNVENKSFKNGLCAEQVAISAAVAEGYKKGDFKELHVYGDGEKFSYPCFLCRQILLEFYDLDGIVHVYKKNGEEEILLVKDLCPYPFEFEGEKMYKELLALMGNAHATYDDKCFSSIVVMKDGTTFSGVTVKNQIFRDAVYAEQASIARAVSKGYKYGDFDKIYIMVGTDHLNDLRHINRDFITEFMEPESQVWLYNKDGDHRILKVGNLLFNIY